MLLLMKDGVNLFKKEDQKYNLISYTNEEELTLKEVLLDKLNFSVRSISKMKREQSVFVNGVFKKPSTKLKKGDLIEVKIEEEMANFEPQNLNLNILYDDFDIIMVNKPPFMVVHPTKSHFDNTIANGITYYIKEKSEKVKELPEKKLAAAKPCSLAKQSAGHGADAAKGETAPAGAYRSVQSLLADNRAERGCGP